MTFPILTVLILAPAVTAVLIGLAPGRSPTPARVIALAGSLATFLLSLLLLAWFRVGEAGFQLEERVAWVPQWDVTYRVGIDGLSLFLVLLTTLLIPLVVLAGWNQADRAKGFFGSILAMEAAMVGVFVALDLIVFYVFFEAMLVPMYGLIGIWGSGNRRYAAVKFFLYTLVGGFIMLVGILYLYFAAGDLASVDGLGSFDYDAIRQVELSATEQTWLFLAFFAAFAIKVPIFPLHTWLPDAHTEAPTVGSVILAAIMLKIGGYGFLRFSLPFFPDASVTLAPLLLALGVIGVLYGALVAMMQGDVKRLVAYSSVSHLGFVIIGTFALTPTGASGSVVQMVNHGLSTGALFLLIGFLYERAHSRRIADYSGLLRAAPILGGLFLVVALSSLALPGLNGFVGEFPILVGSFQTVPWAAVGATLGVILAAIYLLWAYQRMFHGPVDGLASGITDLTVREVVVMAPIVLLIVGLGLYPEPVYERVNPTVESIVEDVNGHAGLTENTPLLGTGPDDQTDEELRP